MHHNRGEFSVFFNELERLFEMLRDVIEVPVVRLDVLVGKYDVLRLFEPGFDGNGEHGLDLVFFKHFDVERRVQVPDLEAPALFRCRNQAVHRVRLYHCRDRLGEYDLARLLRLLSAQLGHWEALDHRLGRHLNNLLRLYLTHS